MRFAFIRRHAGEFPVTWMCQVLDVSLSGYYAWLNRPESQRSRDDRRLLIEIRTIHRQSRRTYGSPRMVRELRPPATEVGGCLLFDMFDDAFPLHDPDVLRRDGRADGMARVGEAMGELAALLDQDVGEFAADHHATDRQVAR